MMMEHTNEQRFSNDLPRVEALSYEKLQPDYRWVMIIRRVISIGMLFFLVLMGAFVLINQGLGEYVFPLFGVFGLVAIYRIGISFVAYPRMGFALRTKDVIYREGVFYHRLAALPYDRIQHAEVHSDLIERLMDLSSLRIYTAGGSASDLEIPGLRPDQALSMRAFILKRTDRDEEE